MGYASILKNVAKSVLPHGLVTAVIRSQAVRRRRIAAISSRPADTQRKPYAYSDSIEFLCARGLLRDHVIGGSIPEASLAFCSKHLDVFMPTDRPILGLHVGNFLGVSLAYFVDYARRKHQNSIVVSIDPNLTHRGIESPQDHVVAVLNHFGLQQNAMICVGYSGGKSISNDGFALTDSSGIEYDPFASYVVEQSCENSLANLCEIWKGRFDFAVMDGNHDAAYLRSEIAIVRTLLAPGGVLVLDDVDDAWADIKEEFGKLGAMGWRAVGADGRVGILELPRSLAS
jgi:Methyltransferase domain